MAEWWDVPNMTGVHDAGYGFNADCTAGIRALPSLLVLVPACTCFTYRHGDRATTYTWLSGGCVRLRCSRPLRSELCHLRLLPARREVECRHSPASA
jgi:hypothetical protein|eukprot:COSAG01_NODE_2057_length_8526_cov_21.248576_1_plen_97_part_00